MEMKLKLICSVVPVEMVEALREHLLHFHLCKDYGLYIGELPGESFYDCYKKSEFKALFMKEEAWNWPATIELVQTARSDFQDGWNRSKKFMEAQQTEKAVQWMKDYVEAIKENKNYKRL